MMEYRDFSKELFDRHPVWKWNATADGHCPVENFDPLPKDESTLFIKAIFTAASGEVFDGYLVGLERFYAFGLFVSEEEYVINLRLPETAKAAEVAISGTLGKSVRLFPLRYETSLHFAGEPRIAGTLDAL